MVLSQLAQWNLWTLKNRRTLKNRLGSPEKVDCTERCTPESGLPTLARLFPGFGFPAWHVCFQDLVFQPGMFVSRIFTSRILVFFLVFVYLLGVFWFTEEKHSQWQWIEHLAARRASNKTRRRLLLLTRQSWIHCAASRPQMLASKQLVWKGWVFIALAPRDMSNHHAPRLFGAVLKEVANCILSGCPQAHSILVIVGMCATRPRRARFFA